ncbi:MAG TPA: helix-turn-helix domain-containing protein [Pseudorhodoferax sp.]|jgi:DNA-binding IclR family transcriptional regulator|nr:helix-turn-helix domain-containing protein [Pseudorhodoferax sp.]
MPTAAPPSTEAYAAPDGSLDKMLSILNLFSEDVTFVTQDDIMRHVGCSRATAYRYLKSLSTVGLIAPVHGGAYVIGTRAIELDRLLRLRDPILLAAREPMAEVARSHRVNVMLCCYYGDKVMCADLEWPDTGYRSSYERGRPMPMFLGATAKAILAHLTPYQQRNLMLWHANEIRAAGLGDDWDSFRANLRRLRKMKAVVSHGEIDAGLVGIAAPLFSADQKVLGSFVLIVPSGQEPARLEQLQEIAADGAARVTATLSQVSPGQAPVRAMRPRRGEG